MKYFYTLLLAFIVLPNLLVAQNLVPNPSFEDTVGCPTGAQQINAASSWSAARSSPDYFHPCANTSTPIVGVPDNFPGYQLAFQGQSYVGVITYYRFNGGYREHIQVLLNQPLQVGVEYFVSAYISRGDSAFLTETFDCSSNNFGFRFSNRSYDALAFNFSPIDNFAHIYSDDIIYDSVDWVQISGSFIADSAYSYLLIGNFFDDSNTTTNSCIGVAYYYIDNVCVSAGSQTCGITSAVNPLHQPISVSLFPNPANNFLSLKNLKNEAHYSIMNSNGISIRQGSVSASENAIPVSILPNGLYFLRLNNKHTYKFIISH